MNTYNILTPVDNTKLDGNIDKTYVKGISEYNRLYIPNEGIDNKGDSIHYMPYGAISIKDKVAVDTKSIFLKNGFLQKSGIIVEKYYINKKQRGLLLGNEKYFRVLDSNIDTVKDNDLVIVQADQGYRFNIDKKEYFFVQSDKILIVLNDTGIIAGPDNMLLKSIKNYKVLGIKEEKHNKGEYNGHTYYFSDASYEIDIDNITYIVVSKKDLVIVD